MMIKGYKGGGGKGGGGGGGNRTPVESPDSLRSRAFARVVDLVCEGEIEGLATGDFKSIYLDQTPIMNEDGTFNFTGVTIATRNGTQAQSHIPGFPSVEAETAVNVEVIASTPVVRTISALETDAVRVTVSFPQMTDVNVTNGDTRGTSVELKIEVQPNAGVYTEVVSDIVSGKATTKYQKSYLIQLNGTGPWNVRVSRITEDSGRATLQNKSYWESFTEIVNAKLTYPNSALVATVIDSQQFSQIPQRAYDMKLMRSQIPSNATVREDGSLTYSGSWDGLFQISWHSNPAWVFWDMITNDRYGLGQFVTAAQVDKWSLYSIGQYCDELVDDGFGGTEPRFSCNIYLQEQNEAFKVIQDLASIFRGICYWSSGALTAVQDAPSDPVALFGNANVVDGLFTYQGSSLKTRHSVALVSWNDPDDFYALKPEYVEDVTAIERYGVIQTEVVAVGCTSRGQAHRVGKWLLYSEAYETETVTFKTGLDGILVRPGQVINVQDKDRAGTRRGGRVVSATTTVLTVDQAFTKTTGVTYTLSAMMPDGTVDTSTVTTVVGNVITVSPALSAAPQANAVWMVSSTDVQLQQFRVVSVIDAGDGTFEVTGLKSDAQKYDYVENGLILVPPDITQLNQPPDAPTNVTISEELYETSTDVKNLVTIAWDQTVLADTYTIVYRVNNNNGVTVIGLRSQIYEIRDALPGDYSVTVYALSISGKRSQGATATAEIFGKLAVPGDVLNFSIVGISDGVAQLVWDKSVDLDVVIGGYVRIRYTPDNIAPDWSNAVDIGPSLSGGVTSAQVPHVNGTYLAKFVDSSGFSSENAAFVQTTIASLTNLNVISVIDESTFTGAKTGTYYSGTLGGLVLDSGTLIDDFGLMDTVLDMDTTGGILEEGTYDFASTFDLGGVYTSLLTASIAVTGYDQSDFIDARVDDIDTWSGVDGGLVEDVNATLYVRTTDDDPSGSPTWSSWRPFFIGQYVARAFQFQLLLTSESSTHNIICTGLTVTVDMPDRTESGVNITSGAGTYTVTFPAAFKAIPAIGITSYNMATGDYYVIANRAVTGFDVTFKNSAAANVSRNFDYLAKGYGYLQ